MEHRGNGASHKRSSGPDYTVGVDPNTEFKYLHTATRLAEQLEPFGTVANFEDPVLKTNLDWYRLLREKTHIPQALHLGPPGGVLAALKAECIDYVNLGWFCPKPTKVRLRWLKPQMCLAGYRWVVSA